MPTAKTTVKDKYINNIIKVYNAINQLDISLHLLSM